MKTRVLIPAFAACLAFTAAHAVEFQRWKTADGVTITLVERHELPIVNMQITFKGAGRVAEHKPDLAAFTATMLPSGTEKYGEEALRDESNRIGVTVSTAAGPENTTISFASLSRRQNLSDGLKLANQIIARPKFDPAVLNRTKGQALTSLKQSLSDPGFLAGRAVTLLNYGSHPYANSARSSEESINGITLEDLSQFHRSHYAKNNAYVAIVGDIDRRQAEKTAAAVLEGLPAQAAARTEIPEIPNNAGRRQDIPFDGKEQASVIMELPLIVRQDPDRYALAVGNYILGGGGFDSRLMKKLRDEKGLVYGVSSSLSPMTRKGPFSIAFSTKKDSAEDALAAARAVLADFIAEGPTEAELKQAKDNIVGSFPMTFDTNAKTVAIAANVGANDLPLDYYDTYTAHIEAVTAEQVREVWRRRLNPQELNVVVVGKGVR